MPLRRKLEDEQEPGMHGALPRCEDNRNGQNHEGKKENAEGALTRAFVIVVSPEPWDEAMERGDTEIEQQRPVQHPEAEGPFPVCRKHAHNRHHYTGGSTLQSRFQPRTSHARSSTFLVLA